MDVPEKPAETIAVVEPWIGFELHAASGRCESFELVERLARVALALPQLGRVDLHEAHAIAATNVESVAVPDARDRRASPCRLLGRLCAPDEKRAESENGE